LSDPGRSGDVECSFDTARLDVDLIHGFLSRDAYWSPGVPRTVVERAIANSLCIGAYHERAQVGFARVVTDRATFAYLADVFVVATARGAGVGKRMLEAMFAHPDLQGLRRFMLFTADAQGLYRQFGFTPLARPERGMEIMRADAYAAVLPERSG
jgi:GNAT superfamily N-acetyltransferase